MLVRQTGTGAWFRQTRLPIASRACEKRGGERRRLWQCPGLRHRACAKPLSGPGLIARRAKIVERTRACGSASRGSARCCDATLVSPLSRTGLQQPCAAAHNGATLRVAERRKRAAYPELNGGPKQFVVLGSEAGGRWNADAQQLLRDLVRVRAHRAPPAVRSAASSTWAKRWWAMLAVSVQQAVTMAVGKSQGIGSCAEACGRPLTHAKEKGPWRKKVRGKNYVVA